MSVPIRIHVQLLIVQLCIAILNFFLATIRFFLFLPSPKPPKSILIYKVGNIGDTICAVPSFIAIRRHFSSAKITLLSSPGGEGAVGASDLLKNAWYFDNIITYYKHQISSPPLKRKFIKDLKNKNFDLFIQFPDDLANFRTLLRNLFFAKLIGARSAFGFSVRTIQLFKKAQVDYSSQESEVISLLDLLRSNNIAVRGVEYDFPVSEVHKNNVQQLFLSKWSRFEDNLIVVLNPGGKREANRWPPVRFGMIGKYLQDQYDAKIVIIGGESDLPNIEIIKTYLNAENLLILANRIKLLEIIEIMRRVDFLVSNDTGAAHMAAAVGLPVVGIYCIRNVFGRWLPYGNQHKILYHKFISCDYRTEECIKKSTDAVTVEEVKRACDEIIKEING